jgi:hypothetical protein
MSHPHGLLVTWLGSTWVGPGVASTTGGIGTAQAT